MRTNAWRSVFLVIENGARKFGERAFSFSHADPAACNSLAEHIRAEHVFRKLLKTHLLTYYLTYTDSLVFVVLCVTLGMHLCSA